MPLTHGELFAGYSGLHLALSQLFDIDLAWTVENDPAACKVLDWHWPGVPNLGDITTIDWSTVEPVDVLSGGFPCQDVSAAGRRAGLRPETRSGLWSHFAYAIDQLRPPIVIIENVRGLTSADAHCDMEPCPWCLGDAGEVAALRALGAVLGDLADLGYDARWASLRASDVGAPHLRDRVFIVAHPADPGRGDLQRRAVGGGVGGAEGTGASEGLQRERGRDAVGDGRAALADAGSEALGLGTGLRESGPGRVGRRRSDHDDPSAPTDAEREPRRTPPRQRPGSGQAAGGGQAGLVGGRDPIPSDADEPGRQRSGPAEPAGRTITTVAAPPDPDSGRLGPRDLDLLARQPDIEWGVYEPAIRRWEHTLGRTAPTPTEPGRDGQPRLNPRLVEWMMGLPEGWVTDLIGPRRSTHRISRNEALHVLGNGVVPQQATEALRRLLTLNLEETP